MPRIRAPIPIFCLLLASAAHAGDGFDVALLAELNRARTERGLAELAADPELAVVAQRRASAMAAEGWFGLTSPQGAQVEDDLDALPYRFRLVTEKLVRSAASVPALVDEWRLRGEAQRQSLFHADVRLVGIGVATVADVRIVDIVLVQPFEAATAAAVDGPLAVGDQRRALHELVRVHCVEASRTAPRADPLLDQAAQDHAQALLAALVAGRGPESIAPLADRLADLERSRSGMAAGLVASHDAFSGREIIRSPTGKRRHHELATAIVVDARSAAAALEQLLAAPSPPPFLAHGVTRLGIGLAAGGPGDGRVVWIVTARPG